MAHIDLTRDNAIATLWLAHEGHRNALTHEMWKQLRERLTELSADTSLRCVVITGAGTDFASGADISEFPQLRSNPAALRHYHEEIIAPALTAIDDCLHPTVAAVRGVCLGGGFEIACRCDLRICEDSARLGVPINRLGFPMAPAELAGLVALAGRALALELLLEGRILSAQEAVAKNLVTRVVADDELAQAVRECSARIASGAPLAARINRQLVRRLDAQRATLDAAQLDFAFSYANSRDHLEGVQAFLEGRAPHFTGS